jgi:hypothetical protein
MLRRKRRWRAQGKGGRAVSSQAPCFAHLSRYGLIAGFETEVEFVAREDGEIADDAAQVFEQVREGQGDEHCHQLRRGGEAG